MFQLTMEEAQVLRSRSQFVTLKRGHNIKYRPYAFTEQGNPQQRVTKASAEFNNLIYQTATSKKRKARS